MSYHQRTENSEDEAHGYKLCLIIKELKILNQFCLETRKL
jgi:hypothetical protein